MPRLRAEGNGKQGLDSTSVPRVQGKATLQMGKSCLPAEAALQSRAAFRLNKALDPLPH